MSKKQTGMSLPTKNFLTEKVSVSDNGLQFKGDLTFDEWKGVGDSIFQTFQLAYKHQNQLRWWYGDWIAYGEARLPDVYSQALTDKMYAIGTLRNAAYVCRSVPPESRVPELSIDHHYEVARIPVEDQKAWLEKAKAESWTNRELREGLAAKYPKQEAKMKKAIPFEDWYYLHKEDIKKCPTHMEACRYIWTEARKI